VVIRERCVPSVPRWEESYSMFPATFRVFVSNLALPPESFWRDYTIEADMENRIAELKHDLGADDFCMQEFFPPKAAFRSILLLFNLLGEFQRASGCKTYRQPATLRAQVFLCGALLAEPATAWFCICRFLGGLKPRSRCWKTSYPTVSQLRRSAFWARDLSPNHQ